MSPTNQETVLNVVCDNENCPGNELDPADRKDWIFVTMEVYGEPTMPQMVFCSFAPCAASTINKMARPTPNPQGGGNDGEPVPSQADQEA